MEEGQNAMALAVIAYCIALTLFTEVVHYLLIYRTAAFKQLKANLEKHSKKVETAKETATSNKNLKKKQARLDTWKEDAAKQMVSFNYKIGFVTMITVISGFKLLNKLFGGMVVAQLPFHPPSFLQKATHRGLQGARLEDCSALFIYMLCQASIRPMIPKLLGWGPSKLMTELKPSIPKSMQLDMFKEN